MTSFKQYLEKKYAPSTVKAYFRDIEKYHCEKGKEAAEKGTYNDVMAYIEKLRGQKKNPHSINRELCAIKAWYTWLVVSGQRKGHPCRYIELKDLKTSPLQLQDLFTVPELELLMERKERFYSLAERNQVVISLLIYQALTAPEISLLTLNDIDLKEGTIKVKPSRKLNGRTLPLKTKQVMLFYRYIHQIRPAFLNGESERLVITDRGTPENGEGIAYLVETLRPLFPTRKLTVHTIRASVIANRLKTGEDLRKVQLFAGHKKISSTERYRQSASEELKAAIQKYHPLK
jgi:site-specific recombinase XerD